ncbi:MAG TPA: beta-1,3-glucanase family protein [Kofleriaceae bacterium]
MNLARLGVLGAILGAAACGGSDGSGADGGGGSPDAPADFWDPSGIPAAQNVMMFKFENRTNGAYADADVYWSFKTDTIDELHSIAEQPLYDMPANASGRMYFYLCRAPDCTSPRDSKYFDFIEHTIGDAQYNGNTTRVDAFGLKLALRLHSADGTEQTVGEDAATFAQSRDDTFAAFLADVPAEFAPLAQPPNAPYRIVQPGAAGFDAGGAQATYYDSFVDELWTANGLTIDRPGPDGAGLAAYPDVSAALMRHVGATAGTFNADGSLANHDLWADASTFYPAAPADYYARFWHEHGIDGKAYGFPYDDVGGYSTYVSHSDPQYMLVAIGW